MTAPVPAVIQGALVDAKNVAAHKCVRLSIDVPAELGASIVKAFGWPTMADPVTVAVARLIDGATHVEAEPVAAVKGRRPFKELPAATQAALTCQEPRFWAFLREEQHAVGCESEDAAAHEVRAICDVESRSELNSDAAAAGQWSTLLSEYHAWLASEAA